MLHRAASNACSWWWASHIRTKQSKWLQSNLQEMEEKVKYMTKLISEDGDSFAKRAESYYRKRPEILSFVEEFYRAYRSLADRYDHISGELHNANHTIATVFPDQVPYSMDEDEEDGSPRAPPRKLDPSRLPKKMPPKAPEIPKAHVRKFVNNLKIKGSLRKPPKEMQPKNTTPKPVCSQISKDEALKEIDKLQKGILALQTEKEFVKSSYENRLTKYWDIEKEITEMQEKVCTLQDEFSIGSVIEDNEARTLMASTALKSCLDTLEQLQEKQERSTKEARKEYERFKEAQNKLEVLKGEFLQNQTDRNVSEKQHVSESSTMKIEDQQINDLQKDILDVESIREKIKEQLEMNSDASLTVPELAEKIDELVTKIIKLESAVSTQTALITRLRSETDNLQGNLQNLEEDKATLLQDTRTLTEKLREVEGELRAVQNLNKNAAEENSNLQTHIAEANCSVDHLREKLKSAKPVDDESTGSQEAEVGKPCDIELSKEHQEAENKMVSPKGIVKENETGVLETESPSLRVVDRGESPEEPGSGGKARDASGGSCKAKKLDRFVRQDSPQAEEPLYEFSDPENEPNWQQLFANGMDDREHVLLEEYTANLRKYKEIRKELSEVQKKNNNNQQETMLQLKELRSAIAMKDEEIQSLHQKLRFIEESESSQQDRTQDMPAEGLKCQSCSGPILHQNAEATARPDASTTDRATEAPPNGVKDEEKTNALPVGQNRAVPAAEAKFRKDIDGLLEENLDFWMRFSGLFHQIQQFQTTAHDLQGEYAKLKKRSSQEDSTTSKHVHSLKSDARPIYNHLREIRTDLTVWIEQNMLLKDESKDRLASLCSIQEEIERVSKMDPGTDAEFTTYQAAKFQGEVSNMQQENKKVADELQLGLEHVKELRVEIEKTLTQIDEELNFSGSKNHQHHVAHSLSRTRIPLQSFLFGVKAKKQKPSFLACINPALQRRHREMQSHFPL